MICPNCGREMPDSARICPSCTAVQRTFRRRRAEVDMPEQGSVPVRRSVRPDETAHRQRIEQVQAKGSAATHTTAPHRNTVPERRSEPPKSGQSAASTGRQSDRERAQVRHVRRAPEPVRRKLDARPMLLDPPIYQNSHKRLLKILFTVLLLTLFVVSAGWYTLFNSESGQRMMAQWGWSVARTDAYVTLGRELYNQAYYSRALEALEVAIEREPENVDALILMAQAHTELGHVDEATAIYESLIFDIAPAHPGAYRNLIRLYQQQGYNAEALDLMRMGAQNAGEQEFEVMLREYTPTSPTLSVESGQFTEEFDVTIEIPQGETVYYTTDGTDPSETGMIYVEGTEIHVSEGRMTVKAIGFTEDGTPSTQVEANYVVIIPTPAAPRANVASGVYSYAPKVSLRPGGDTKKEKASIVAIYYTLDGRAATPESTLYNDDEPIQLPVGDSVLRAIAVADNGKISYEMRATYKVNGNLKNMFRNTDTFKNMELYKTGYSAFTRTWGTPNSYELLPKGEWYSKEMESYEAVYDWGTARFVEKSKKTYVLYALETTSTRMTAPRTTKVGMSGDEVISKFRDLGHPVLDDEGNRLLYNYDSLGVQFGSYKREADGRFAIHYYYPVDENHTIFVELSYYLDEEGKVEHIVWQRYRSEV